MSQLGKAALGSVSGLVLSAFIAPIMRQPCRAPAAQLPPIVASEQPPRVEVVARKQPRHRQVEAVVTAYCPCVICCESFSGAGITSRGRDARKTRGVAVDPKMIRYGSMVVVPGVGEFLADDTGGAMRQDGRKGIVHIDIRFHDHKEALKFGRRKMVITIKEKNNGS